MASTVHFTSGGNVLPAGPSSGTNVSSAASANTYGSYVEFSAAIGADIYITGITVTANTANINITGTGAFAGGGIATYHDVNLNGTAHTISGSNTFNTLTLAPDTTQTITFTDGTLQTVTNFSRSAGTSVITLQGTGVAGWNIAKSGGGQVSVDYMNITNSHASPANTWYAGNNSTDSGGNTGWIFTSPPVTPTVETDTADVAGITAVLNGEITDTGVIGGTDDSRGFVWDTSHHADPGNTAPPATYANSWTESGSFNTGNFSYEVTGLTPLTLYYYRACAYSVAGWAYGEEIEFFVGEAGKVYFELRPDLDETKIRGQLGIPSDITRGIFSGYSLPITNHTDNESLTYVVCVPSRWDGISDILMHIDCATTDNETGKTYVWHVQWEHFTPNVDVVPATNHDLYYTRNIFSEETWQSFQDWLVIPYDLHPADPIVPNDLIAITLSRNDTGMQNNTKGEIAVFAIDILFARGDLLGDPVGFIEDVIDDLIDDETLIGGMGVLNLGILLCAVLLLIAGGITRNNIFLWVSTGLWLVFSVIMYQTAPSTTSWEYWLAFIGFFVTFGVALYAGFVEYRSSKERGINRAEEVRAAKRDDMSDYIDEDDMAERKEHARMVAIYEDRVGKPKRMSKKEREDREFRRVMKRAEKDMRD